MSSDAVQDMMYRDLQRECNGMQEAITLQSKQLQELKDLVLNQIAEIEMLREDLRECRNRKEVPGQG